jgi:tetratricopeptide (TPR) repeat protein
VIILVGCGVGVPAYDDAVLEGISAFNRNKMDKALADFNRAIKLDSSRVDGFVGRANTLNALGLYQEALKDYDRAIEIDPKLANAYVNRGSVYSHLGAYQKAIADYEKGLELDPKIDDPPSFVKRLFSNDPNTDKGIRRHLEYLKTQVES